MLVMALGAVPGVMATPVAGWAKARPKHGEAVVELFTAQGCASCKEANKLAAKLADRPGLIVLTWAVDYWDYLGWKDTFAQPEFTLRQKAFARHLGPQDVYTPQVVVNGDAQVSGDDSAGVDTLIRAAGQSRRHSPPIRFLSSGHVRVGSGHAPAGRADVWLVRYDPREQDVEVKAGDNRGATVVHRNVVRQLVRLGAWRGQPVTFKTPDPTGPKLATVVLVQGARGGPILGEAETRSRKP